MGRTRLHLDPPGYQRCKEPGFHYWISGADLLQRLTTVTGDQNVQAAVASPFFNPPGSEWLTARPKQMDPNFYRNGTLEAHVLDEAEWLQDIGLTVTEFQPTRKADGTTFSDNLWMLLQTGGSPIGLDVQDWTSIFAAASVEMPSGFVTVASCDSKDYLGNSINLGNYDYHPFLQWRSYPAPDSVWAFSFGPLIYLFAEGMISVLLDPSVSLTNEIALLGQIKAQDATAAGFSPGSLLSFTPTDHSLLTMPVGFEDVYLFFGQGQHKRFRLRQVTDQVAPGHLLATGQPWTIAMAPNQKLACQVQVVGYDTLSFSLPSEGQPLFDLGPLYKPSEDPIVRLVTRFDVTDAAQVTETFDGGTGETTLENTDAALDNAQEIRFTLVPGPAGGSWDGVNNWQGSLDLTLNPGGENIGGFLSPQIRRLELRFPVVLEDRPYSSLILDDSEFAGWEGETSYYDADAKRLRVRLWDSGLQALITSGHANRDYFPLHIEEETAPAVWTIRAAGWVREVEFEEHKTVDPATQESVRLYTFEADGLLCRADTEWVYLPQLVDPENTYGYIEHDFAVRETLRQCGFDTSDSSVYVGQTDPGADTDLARLPGTWGTGSGQTAKRIDSPWAPDWDKTKLEYALMLAQDFRGWLLREDLDGLLRYHQDLMVEALENGRYYSSGTLYWSSTAAAIAGVPGQYIEEKPTRHRKPPRANIIRVTLQDPGDSLMPHYLERLTSSLNDLDDPDFVGEYVPYALTTKLAVEERVLRQMCRLKVYQFGRRSSPWSVQVPLAPWQFTAPIESGHVITVDGYGPHLIVHLEVRELKSAASPGDAIYTTRLTLDKLPSQSTEGTLAGDYPGHGENP
jgi:hypothetical protein